MDELGPSYPAIEGVNPHRPGTDEWHKHNLGLPMNSIGMVGDVTIREDGSGIFIEGWFYGDVPPTLSGWSIHSDGMTAVLND